MNPLFGLKIVAVRAGKAVCGRRTMVLPTVEGIGVSLLWAP